MIRDESLPFYIDQADEQAALKYLMEHARRDGEHLRVLGNMPESVRFNGIWVGWKIFAYSIVHEPVAPRTRIRITCGEKNCCNPFHLAPVKSEPVRKPHYRKET